MIYILAFLLPPLGLLFNGQPFSAIFNVLLIVFGLIFGWFFPVLFLVPSIHGVVAVAMKREDRRHREIVDAIERHGPPPGIRPHLLKQGFTLLQRHALIIARSDAA